MDVRPFSIASQGEFTTKDLQKALVINPFLSCISGHSVCPLEDFGNRRDVRFITLLRNPMRRYFSHFNYAAGVLGRYETFEHYLDSEDMANVQTKKIAGCADVHLAKEVLSERFFLVGIAEEFDAFLLLLQRKLYPKPFNPIYTRKNVTAQHLQGQIPTPTRRQKAAAKERNLLDIELYDFVRNRILPRQCKEYGCGFSTDLDRLQSQLTTQEPPMMKSYADYALRKFYYDPLIGCLRLCGRLPYKGSY